MCIRDSIQSFLEGRGQLSIGRVQPTYDSGVRAADLGALLPTELADTLRAGLRAYERKIAGYTAPEAILKMCIRDRWRPAPPK